MTARDDHLAILVEVSRALGEAETIERIVAVVLDQATSRLEARTAAVFLRQADGDLVAHGWWPAHPDLAGQRQAAGTGLIGHVAVTGRPHLSSDVLADPIARVADGEEPFLRLAPSAITVPLLSAGTVVGVLHLGYAGPADLSAGRQSLLTALADMMGNALQRASAVAHLEERVAERTRELALANTRLEAADRLRDQFVSNVSHELRTPLTNIRLFLDLLQRGRPERHEHYLAVLSQETDRLQTLIDDLLDLSRLDITRTRGLFKPVTVDLVDTVSKAVAALAPRAEAAGIALSCDLASAGVPVAGDSSQLAQVIVNLVANSLTYTPRGGRVTVTVTAAPGRALLAVTDTGVGIPAEEREHVFERFYRGERARASGVPGTGLGLAIVKEIVELHGGEVSVDGQSRDGTRIEVRLPSGDVAGGR